MEVVGAKLLLKLIISILHVSIADSVLSKCQTPLNSSDCGLPSTVVYTYYSPSSICYPTLWRGCPTSNKFDDEDQCLKSCVMHYEVTDPMPKSKNDAFASKVQVNTKSQSVKVNRCDTPLNTSRCSIQMKLIYTYSNEIKSCIMALWSGCPTGNMFPDILSCQDNCQGKEDNELKYKDKSKVQASNIPKELIKIINALNNHNKQVQTDNSKVQKASIDINNLVNKTNAPKDKKILQNYNSTSTVQESSNVWNKLIKQINTPKKEYKLEEKDKDQVQEDSNVFKKLTKKAESLKKGNKSYTTIDLDAKAYFIYKLKQANEKLNDRTERIDFMLLDEYVK